MALEHIPVPALMQARSQFPAQAGDCKLCTHPLGRKIIQILLLLNAENFLPAAVQKLLRGAAGLSPQLGPVPRPFGPGQGIGCRVQGRDWVHTTAFHPGHGEISIAALQSCLGLCTAQRQPFKQAEH